MPSNEVDLLLKREGDFFLKERFASLGFKKKQLAHLNRCQIFLQVISTIDVVIESGDTLCSLIYEGKRDTYHRSQLVWPEQENSSSYV